MRLVFVLAVIAACGKSAGPSAAPSKRDDAGSAAMAASPPVVAPLELGVADVDAYGYRKRAGHPAFKRARELETGGRWPEVAAACREALATDPRHLDASYLLAVALAKTGAEPAAIAVPLTTAVGGDFVKWGAASLAQPALQAFLATPHGTAWQARVTEAHAQMASLLPRALIVSARGDLYAFDRERARFHRLTRTGGAVIAAFRVKAITTLAYLTRRARSPAKVAVGLVDLAGVSGKKPVELPPSEKYKLAYNHQKHINSFVVHASGWHAVDESTKLLALRALTEKSVGYLANIEEMSDLALRGRQVRRERIAIGQISADTDKHRLASAMRIETTRRVVNVPSPGLIALDTVVWSPDKTQLAFVVELTGECTAGQPTSAVFVADVATGSARELERATGGMAVEWVADRILAIAGDRGLAIYDLTTATQTAIAGADGLVSPRRAPACTPEAEETDEQDPDEDGV